jgi:hypothetical protein
MHNLPKDNSIKTGGAAAPRKKVLKKEGFPKRGKRQKIAGS